MFHFKFRKEKSNFLPDVTTAVVVDIEVEDNELEHEELEDVEGN